MRHNRLIIVHFCALLAIVLIPVGCSREEERFQTAFPSTAGEVLAKTTLLATINVGANVYVTGNHRAPAGFAGFIFSEQGNAVAYRERKDGRSRVVHNDRPGKWYKNIEGLALSPDGSRTAFVAQVGEKYCVVAGGKEGKFFDNVGFPRFSPDSRHIVYNATDSGLGRLVVDERVSETFPSSWDELFSGDSKKVISIQNAADHSTHRVVIYDLTLKSRREKELDAGSFIYNKDRSMIAGIGVENGKRRMVELSIDRPEDVRGGQIYDEIVSPAFGMDGNSIAYFAARDGNRVVVLNGKEEMLSEGVPAGPPAVRPDGKAAGIILAGENGHFFHQAFVRAGTVTKRYEGAGQPLYSPDSSRFAYVARRGKGIFMVVDGKEGPVYDAVATPMFSPDSKFLVYRARKDGKRFVVVAAADGKVIRQHQSYEQVFPLVFTADGKSVAYGVKDGNNLIWKVERLESK